MLIVVGSFEVEPARRDEFIASRRPAMEHSRAEPGCHEYTFAADPVVPGRIVLVERWEDEAALDAHLAAARAGRGGPPPSGDAVPVLASTIVKYEVGAATPLG